MKEDFVKKLASLGCAYSVARSKTPADLERTILEGLRYYWESNDLFFMLFSLLVERLHPLVHVERLVSMAKASHLGNDERALLVGLAQKFEACGDRRFKLVSQKLGGPRLRMKNPPESETSTLLIKKWGLDPELKKLGVEVRAFYKESPKKFIVMKKILIQNSWLRLRAIIGPNYRADIVFLKSSCRVKTAYDAAKKLGCSISTAYRIWESLAEIEGLGCSRIGVGKA